MIGTAYTSTRFDPDQRDERHPGWYFTTNRALEMDTQRSCMHWCRHRAGYWRARAEGYAWLLANGYGPTADVFVHLDGGGAWVKLGPPPSSCPKPPVWERKFS